MLQGTAQTDGLDRAVQRVAGFVLHLIMCFEIYLHEKERMLNRKVNILQFSFITESASLK
jgi:hypothetical protein